MTGTPPPRVEITAWPEDEGYSGSDLRVTVGRRIYRARLYAHDNVAVFDEFSDPRIDEKDRRAPFSAEDPEGDRREPFRNGKIPYKDPLFRAAARAVLELPEVTRLEVFTSNRSGTPAPVNLARLFPDGA